MTEIYVTPHGATVARKDLSDEQAAHFHGPYADWTVANGIAKLVRKGEMDPYKSSSRRASGTGLMPGSAHGGAAPERTQPASHSGLAITSMILGILWCAGAGSVLAVIFAAVDFNNAKRHGRKNSGFAIAGLVLGIIGCLSGLTFWILIGIGIHDANQLTNYSNDLNTCISSNYTSGYVLPDGYTCP